MDKPETVVPSKPASLSADPIPLQGEASAEWQQILRQAFMAGFQWCSSGTDKHGEYNGGDVEDGFIDWLRSLSAPPQETQ